DRILTRVGAQDNLARGQSTFLVEMVETASILNQATSRSLILLDEVGRGTSTFDGLAIAWAVSEELHERGHGAKVLFATHYHELTALADRLERVRNFHVAVREWNDEIIFLHKVRPGGTDRSYGIQVARLAGLPTAVIERAKAVLAELQNERADLSVALTPADEVDLALTRHATSKLSTDADLEAIATLGFRGEALPAICAVTRFSVVSCERGADTGTLVRGEGGSVTEKLLMAATSGTVVE